MKLIQLHESARNLTFYHGSPRKFSKFDMKTAEEGNAQDGAGIYFTSFKEHSIAYSENNGWVFEVLIKFRKEVKSTGKPKRKDIEKLIKGAPDLEDTLANWGEDTAVALEKAIDAMVKYAKSERDGFDQVWYDFYNGHVDKYLEGMIKLGYDGFYLKKFDGEYHAIVFNPKSIKVIRHVSAKEIKQELEQ